MKTNLIPFTDWESNAHSMTVQRGQNAHYVSSLERVLMFMVAFCVSKIMKQKLH